jgi:hypothetical protein
VVLSAVALLVVTMLAIRRPVRTSAT